METEAALTMQNLLVITQFQTRFLVTLCP